MIAQVSPKLFMLVDDCLEDAVLVKSAFSDAPPAIHQRHCGNSQEAVCCLTGQGKYGDRQEYPLPNVILLDLGKSAFDGFEFLHWLRTKAPGDLRLLPVICMANAGLTADINRAYALGANLCIPKPLDWNTFRDRVRLLAIFWGKHVECPEIDPPDWSRDAGDAFLTRLTVLPEAAEPDSGPVHVPAAPAPAGSVRFLLVEDNPTDVFFIERQLQGLNRASLFHCEDAETAVLFLTGFGEFADRDLHPLPDAILLDLMLPGLDGFKFLEWLRFQAPADARILPVIVMTTSRSPEHIRLAYSLGANLYMYKPFDWEILTERISMLGLLWSSYVESPKSVIVPA